jgi:hypothetical protein
VRLAAELGSDVMLVKSDRRYADQLMHAALVTNFPNYASAIVTTKKIVDAISVTNAGIDTNAVRVG